jgi:hypothetical protein
LHGRGDSDLSVREALWGKPGGFDKNHPFYKQIARLSEVRREHPALRYGRLYFRPISGNGADFGVSPFRSGVIAFSRILNDIETVVVANTNVDAGFTGEVIVDALLNPDGAQYRLVYSNRANPHAPGSVLTKGGGAVRIQEPGGGITTGPARTVRVELERAEIQILEKAP